MEKPYRNLADRAWDYMRATNRSITQLCIDMGNPCSRSTLSRYLNGKFDGTRTDVVEKALTELLDGAGEFIPAPDAPRVRDGATVYKSRDAQSIIGMCTVAQEEIGLGVIVGQSGYGKTHTLKSYAKMPKVVYIECDDTMNTSDLVTAIARKVGLPGLHRGLLCDRTDALCEYFNVNLGHLLIVDEADKLIGRRTIKKLEVLRKLYDKSNVGVVIAGEPALEMLLKNYDMRFANRIDFFVRLGGLSADEVEDYLCDREITEDALRELKARACDRYTGCFRLLARTMKNVDRVLEEREDKTITLPVIQAASSMMLL